MSRERDAALFAMETLKCRRGHQLEDDREEAQEGRYIR